MTDKPTPTVRRTTDEKYRAILNDVVSLGDLVGAVATELGISCKAETETFIAAIRARGAAEVEQRAREVRDGEGGFGALVTPPLPAALIDQVAAGLAPVLRGLVQEAVAARLDTSGPRNLAVGVAEVRIAPTDLRPSREAG